MVDQQVVSDSNATYSIVSLEQDLEMTIPNMVETDLANNDLTCVEDQAAATDPGVCTYTHEGTEWDATATDNFEVVSIQYVLSGATTGTGTGAFHSIDGVIFNKGETTVTWTATDSSENTDVCSFTVTVEDNEPPTFSFCPEDIAENTQGGSCHRNINPPDPEYSDNCEIESVEWVMTGASEGSGTGNMGNTTFNAGVTEVTYTVSDTSENSASCSFTVTITDNIPPEIACPENPSGRICQ